MSGQLGGDGTIPRQPLSGPQIAAAHVRGGSIEVRGLTKRYGAKTAVEGLTFDVRPGVVTGFLGPNGSGKTTTMRMILGLDNPTAGTVTVGGKAYRDLPAPLREIGALIDPGAVHPKRSARNHLLALAQSNRIGAKRVEEVLGMVGLSEAAGRKVGGFSLGMSQRLGIAAAMLGDPGVVMLDEPVNGLDPEGIVWIRRFMRALAAEGRTVLVSSHLMNEMAHTADHVVVIGRGKLLRDEPISQFVETSSGRWVTVRTPRFAELTPRLIHAGASVIGEPDGALRIVGLDAIAIGETAAAAGIALHELTPHRASLEEAFMELTHDSVEYTAGSAA
ncbi:MAG: ABC transporter ATP-binding protein [Sporichthyaceae bacterium]